MVEWLFLAVLWGYLWFVIVVFPDHTHLLFFKDYIIIKYWLLYALKEEFKTNIVFKYQLRVYVVEF